MVGVNEVTVVLYDQHSMCIVSCMLYNSGELAGNY